VYRYHPEWTVERVDWWRVDHERYPEWFLWPFWVQYPLWTFGAYDEYHVWRDVYWWHARDPVWVYTHHPGWVEPYPIWMRADHARHPEWFRSAYWQKHPHDWRSPDEAYRIVRGPERSRPGVGVPIMQHRYEETKSGKPAASQASSATHPPIRPAAVPPKVPATTPPKVSAVEPNAPK